MKIFHNAEKRSYWRVTRINKLDNSYALLNLGWEDSARRQGILVNSRADDKSLRFASMAAQIGLPIANAIIWVRCKENLKLGYTYCGGIPELNSDQKKDKPPYFQLSDIEKVRR